MIDLMARDTCRPKHICVFLVQGSTGNMRYVWFHLRYHSKSHVQYKMSSQSVVRVNSFVRGYHEYLDIWQPAISSEHSLRREPGNEVDKNAVAVARETQSGNTTRASSQAEHLNTHPNEIAVGMEVVGHVPKLMAQWVTKFLKRALNSGTVLITGKRIHRVAGYGLELPCEFKFQGNKYSCDWLKEELKKENFDVL